MAKPKTIIVFEAGVKEVQRCMHIDKAKARYNYRAPYGIEMEICGWTSVDFVPCSFEAGHAGVHRFDRHSQPRRMKMAQHYTLNTVEAAAFCRKCGKETMHKVEGKKLSYCMTCMAKPLTKKRTEPAQQMTIKEVYGSKPV